MIRRVIPALFGALALLGTVASPAAAMPGVGFEGWASAIVAADWRTSRGTPIQAFDNARRDLVAGFTAVGFDRADMVDFTLRPDVPNPTGGDEALAAITEATARATKGCFLYFTSHGSPRGIVFGPDRMISPMLMDRLVDGWCGERPTVVVVSACFSGVFADQLAAPNRMIMTAARRDRSSFGCSEDATYPYFDGCVLDSLPTAPDFLALADQAALCVERREQEEGLSPASGPQTVVGVELAPLLSTTYAFRR